MKKNLILTMTLLAAAATATAEVLTPSEALERALGEAPATMRKAPGLKTMKLNPAMTIGKTAEPEIYIMTPTAESLMILSAESETPALLGYADTAFDPANIPPAMQAMLATYSSEIKAVRAGIAVEASGSRADMSVVEPLCRTTWNQDMPYNLYCPKLNSQRCMTGCVATAMAQILKAIEWPAKCNGGSETYKWAYGNQDLTLDFDDIELNWEVMRDNYPSTTTNTASKAVATLMQALGYAGHMNYSPTASGTHGVSMAAGLIKHFDFDASISYELHDWYTQTEWETLIHKQLEAGFPVYCDGVNADYSMGHAFVIDGYAGDGYFHLNWGWGGMSDGYYRMTALDPVSQGIGGSTGGYNFAQGIIAGLKKGATTPLTEIPMVFQCYDTFGVTESTVTKASQATFTGGFYNLTPMSVKNVTPGVKFVNNETGEERLLRSTTSITQEIPTNIGIMEYPVTMNKSIPEGEYTVYPTIYDRTNKITYDMRTRIGGYGCLHAKVTSSEVIFSEPVRAEVKATNIKVTSPAYVGTPFTASVTLTNTGNQPYNGFVTPALFIKGGGAVQAFEAFLVELQAGESKDYSFVCNLGTKVTAGTTYAFAVMAESGKQAGNAIDLKVSARPAYGVMKVDELKVTNTAQNNLTFELTASCTSGYYSEPLFVVIFRKSGTGNYLDYFMSEPQLVNTGESTTVTISSTFAAGTPGTTYSAIPFYFDASQSANTFMEGYSLVQFTLTDGEYGDANTGALESVETESNEPVEYYDLQGRRLNGPGRGITIRRRGDKTEKVL